MEGATRSHMEMSHLLSTPPWKRLLRKRGHRMFREIYGLRGAQEQINSHILTIVLTGFALLLETQYLHQVTHAEHSPGMEHDGSLEVMEQIRWRIQPMESHGLRPLLGMGSLQASATPSPGMEHVGSLEDMEQISWRIQPMESHGLRPLLEMRCLQMSATPSHGMVLDGLLEAGLTIGSRILLME
jgi:hypothetical protein